MTPLSLLMFLCSSASAHSARASTVALEVGTSAVHVEMQVPRDQLEMVLDPEAVELSAYVLEHLSILDAEGVALEPRDLSTRWTELEGAPHLAVSLDLEAPDGARLSTLTLRDDVVLHQVVSHKILVTVARDLWALGPDAEPALAGLIRWPEDSLVLEREPPSRSGLLASAARMGATHILGGWDHLLFLWTLLIVAPTRAEAGRWVPRGSARGALTSLATLITAFTLGHSVTLALAALGLVTAPAAWVELAIALSIGLAAAHAIRPLWPRAELLFAGGFGLVHGLAFAEDLLGLGVDLEAALFTLLGFDLGVEAVQLSLGAGVIPLMLLARGGRLAPLRTALGALALLAATLLTAERALLIP
ncbi:MAG: HupE/UreJ family protein [Alphaproteobacteria bacterium]|nr:HupE/UreJ family protein [Alphaproteobacteria bacterium]